MQMEVLSLMLRAQNMMLPNMGYHKKYVFFAYKLNFIAIGYRRNLCMFKNYHFTKFFIKLGAVVCVCLCSERRQVSWNSFPIWIFIIKRKKKDAMGVSSSNSVNSAIMYNTETTIKISFVITKLISAAIMIIVFN